MLFEQFKRLDVKLYVDGRLAHIAFLPFERNGLEGRLLKAVIVFSGNGFERNLGVGFHFALVAQHPTFALGSGKGVTQVIIAVVHKLYGHFGVAQLPCVFGNEGQIHVQTVAAHTFFNRLAKSNFAVGRVCFVLRFVVSFFVFVSAT